jgi:8-oxo-dGTP diphosphatase
VLPKRGCAILFFRNDERKVLLFRRDDKPGIPYPKFLDIPGGNVEEHESADQAIVREMAEELDDLRTGSPYFLNNFKVFKVYKDKQGTEQHIFYRQADFDVEDLRLKEGEGMVWLTEDDLKTTILAFNFQDVVQEFFKHFPQRRHGSTVGSCQESF